MPLLKISTYDFMKEHILNTKHFNYCMGFFICSFFMAISPAFAFDISDYKNISKLASQNANNNTEDQVSSESQPDNSIDPQTYYIGGGDVFMISVIQSPSIHFNGIVNENCDVFIGDLGLIKIGKQTLARAKITISDFVTSKLNNRYSVYVSLIKVKTAVVTVSGGVLNPGTFTLKGSVRILDAIRMANNNTIPLLNELDFRAVRCENRDTTRTYDLFSFLKQGNLAQNPYVYPGDNICLSYAKQSVFIIGAIKTSSYGDIPIQNNEPLSGFLSLFTFEESADSNHIVVERTDSNGKAESRVLSVRDAQGFILHDKDLIIVSQKKNYPKILMVSVGGEIARPGYYPLLKNISKASDIIELAGGPTPEGQIDRAYVVRRKKMLSDEFKKNVASVKPSITGGTADNSVRPEINSSLFHMNTANDFAVLRTSDHPEGILLEQDDEIVIPKEEHYVYVSGSVRTPGAYAFLAGKDKEYYIAQAGGYSSKADHTNVSIVAYFGEVQQIKDNQNVEPGDIIVVPDAVQYKFLTSVLLPIIATAASVVATLLVLSTNIKW